VERAAAARAAAVRARAAAARVGAARAVATRVAAGGWRARHRAPREGSSGEAARVAVETTVGPTGVETGAEKEVVRAAVALAAAVMVEAVKAGAARAAEKGAAWVAAEKGAGASAAERRRRSSCTVTPDSQKFGFAGRRALA
jgi:hypothetical protein